MLRRFLVALFILLSVLSLVAAVQSSEMHLDAMKVTMCHDSPSCLAVHLKSSVLVNMINSRCNLDKLTVNFNSTRRITFTHLPKTGGSSLHVDLAALAGKKRMQFSGHDHFLQTFHDSPDNIFVTMLREPVSRAISYYTYVQQVNRLDADKRKNKLWMSTHRTKAVQWANSSFVQRTLSLDPLSFFLTNVSNLEDNVSRFDYKAIQTLKQTPLNPVVPGTLQEFLNYTYTLPEEYQCVHHLNVAFILLKQYEVVGTLENREDFFRTLYRRAQLVPSGKEPAVENKSWLVVSAEDKALMREYLTRPLFCGRVLWKIAGMISDADTKCVASKLADRR